MIKFYYGEYEQFGEFHHFMLDYKIDNNKIVGSGADNIGKFVLNAKWVNKDIFIFIKEYTLAKGYFDYIGFREKSLLFGVWQERSDPTNIGTFWMGSREISDKKMDENRNVYDFLNKNEVDIKNKHQYVRSELLDILSKNKINL